MQTLQLPPPPLSKSDQIEFLVQRDAQCSKAYAKTVSNSFKLGYAYISEDSKKTKKISQYFFSAIFFVKDFLSYNLLKVILIW